MLMLLLLMIMYLRTSVNVCGYTSIVVCDRDLATETHTPPVWVHKRQTDYMNEQAGGWRQQYCVSHKKSITHRFTGMCLRLFPFPSTSSSFPHALTLRPFSLPLSHIFIHWGNVKNPLPQSDCKPKQRSSCSGLPSSSGSEPNLHNPPFNQRGCAKVG